MANELEIKKEGVVSLVENHDLGNIIKPLVNEIHLFDSFVAGTTHLDDKSVLEVVEVGNDLILRREDNKFDSNAVLVLMEDGRKLGYVPEKDNLIFARLMDAGKLLKAKVTKKQQKGSFTQISIGIYLVDF
ncbi:MAG: HIRAN domain-containing protein [Eubacteriales bacterium]|nr:HIRAN domain-containing protein [Eubacteriales bacterium]